MTPSEIERFDREGFVVLRQAVAPALVARLCEAVDAAVARYRPADAIHFCWNGATLAGINEPHRYLRPASLAVAGAPALQAIGRALCGDAYVTVSEWLVAKYRDDKARIGWHQDMIHDRSARMATIGIYLTPSRADDGGVRYLPGSQHAPQDMAQLAQSMPATESADLSPGDVVVHDVMTVHGSAPLTRQQRRLTLYCEFRPAAHVRANPRFSDEWLAQRRQIEAAAAAAYRRFSAGAPDADVDEGALVAAAYAVRAQIEAARY